MTKTLTKIGKVTHYFDKINVAVIKLSKGDLKINDSITFETKSGDTHTQKISSMQIEHADIDIARAGDEFGLKTDFNVKAGTLVLKEK